MRVCTPIESVRAHTEAYYSLALRLYPIVQGTSRVATKDLVLPLGGGDHGQSPVFVSAGTLVVFHFVALHKREDLWGEDADEFKPERWQDEKASWVRQTPFFEIRA